MTIQINKKDLHKTISNIHNEMVNDKIDLDPPYQRGRVWLNKDKQAFIDSIYYDILPSPIIMNNDNTLGKYICIDGKQRITTIVEFIENKFSINIDEKNVFYSKIPKENKSECRIFDQRERNMFDSRYISVVMYEDLNAGGQIDMFYRINQGVKLTAEEINEMVAKNYPVVNQIIDDSEILQQLEKYTGKSKNINLLLKMIFIITNDTDDPFKIPKNLNDLREFYDNLDLKLIDNTKEIIIKLLTDDAYGLFKHANQNLILSGIYFIKEKDLYTKEKKIKSIANKVYDLYDLSDKVNNKSLDAVYKMFDEEFEKENKKLKKIMIDDQLNNVINDMINCDNVKVKSKKNDNISKNLIKKVKNN